MLRLGALLSLVILSPVVFAADTLVPPLVLDKVFFQVSAKEWVSTQSALLGVTINATLTNADLVKTRADIMERLNKIAKTEWHLSEFNRSQDSSGLEKLTVQAQARIDQSALTNVYQNAKSVSFPGAKYEITQIEFKPSLEEVQTVLGNVRSKLYQQVNEEITRLNKAYPLQNYSLSHLVFVSGDAPPVQPRAYQAKELNTLVMTASSAPALTVSNELQLTAMVEVASNRKQSSN